MKRPYILLGALAFLASCSQRTERRAGFEVHGIDVSHYQKQVDWPLVASQNLQFAFAKATEGASMQDSLFCKNWDAMRSAGLLRGAYHFFRPSISAELQARNFIATTDLQHGDLPPVLDVEVADGQPTAAIAEGVKTWLAIVGDHWKIRPIVYSNQKFYNQHLAGKMGDHPIWIARYTDREMPALADGRPWHFWQYGCQGRLPGVVGDVDFNVFSGSLASLQALAFQRPAPLLDRVPELLAPAAVEPADTVAAPVPFAAANP